YYKLGLSQTVEKTSISNTTKIKISVGDDANESGSTSSILPRTTDINTNCASTEDENKEICSYDTIDALPHVDHYRNLFSITSPEPKSRPTLEALHETASTSGRFRLGSTIDLNSELLSTLTPQTDQLSQLDIRPKIDVVKFGWIIGVFIRCILNIFGVMLFLRLSWVTGQAGIGLAAIIVLTSTAVTVLTALSMSAICTNGEVKGGGTYYLISR
ncbi:unnamed protein product, partial [Rotaria magnacalcarata]